MSTSTLKLATSSPSANSGSELCTPWIPPELIVLILVELWQGAHTPQERSNLLVNVALVNRTWLTLIAHITTLDVRISNYKETTAFLQLLPQSSPIRECRDLLTMERKRAANQSCRSLTCHVDGRRWRNNIPTDNDPVLLSEVFRNLCVVRHFPPNLRHISILHTNWPLNHIFLHLRIMQNIGFPAWPTMAMAMAAKRDSRRFRENPFSVAESGSMPLGVFHLPFPQHLSPSHPLPLCYNSV